MLCSKTFVGRKTFHAPDSTEIYRRPKFQAWPIEFFGNLLLPSLYCIGKPYKTPQVQLYRWDFASLYKGNSNPAKRTE